MTELVIGNCATELWHTLVRQGEERAHRHLDEDCEAYLVFTLMRHYRDVPLAHRTMALEWLAALDQAGRDRQHGLRDVGDRCLLLAGLYPQLAERRRVNLAYFIDLGRGAYAQLAAELRDALAALYRGLAACFDDLVRVLLALRNGGIAVPTLIAAPAQPSSPFEPTVLCASTRRH